MSTLLEVSGVSVTFDGFRAINNLSFNIGSAEMRAIIGPNGAGKTTFMDIVTGKTKPDEGRVIWGKKSESLLGRTEAQIARARDRTEVPETDGVRGSERAREPSPGPEERPRSLRRAILPARGEPTSNGSPN